MEIYDLTPEESEREQAKETKKRGIAYARKKLQIIMDEGIAEGKELGYDEWINGEYIRPKKRRRC
jgi:hypothetical protein